MAGVVDEEVVRDLVLAENDRLEVVRKPLLRAVRALVPPLRVVAEEEVVDEEVDLVLPENDRLVVVKRPLVERRPLAERTPLAVKRLLEVKKPLLQAVVEVVREVAEDEEVETLLLGSDKLDPVPLSTR